MRWQEENAANLRALREDLEDPDSGEARRILAARDLDAILETEPEMDAPAALCVRAWCELDTCRAIGMDVGPVPWTAILAWCEFHAAELDHEATLQVMDVIRQLDIERAERQASKRALENAGRPR